MQAFAGPPLVVLLVLMATGGLTVAMWLNQCIDSVACQCISDDVIRCQCPKTHSRIAVKPFHLLSSKSLVSFSDCQELHIDTMSLSSAPLDSVEIVGVRNLVMRPPVYYDVHGIDGISIVDTILDEIGSHSFFVMSNVARIEFRNVTINHIRPSAFQSLKEIDTFLIQNCVIGTIHQMAFNDTTNIRKFIILNSHIEDMSPFALVLRNVDDFLLINSTIVNWRNQSLTLVNVTQVLVDSCHFRSMDDSALTTILTKRLEVHKNHFRRLSANAWNGIADADNVTFVDNRVERAEADSLTVLMRDNANNDVRNNYITCDEHICWVFDEEETSREGADFGGSSFFEANFCLENGTTPTAISFSRFFSLADDEDVCRTDHTSGEGSFVSDDRDGDNATVISIASKSNHNFPLPGFLAQVALYLLLSGVLLE